MSIPATFKFRGVIPELVVIMVVSFVGDISGKFLLRMVATRSSMGQETSSKGDSERVARPPVSKGKRPATSTGPNTLPESSAAAEAARHILTSLSAEELEMILQHRAQKANPQPPAITVVEVEDVSLEAKTVQPAKRTRAEYEEAEFNGRLFGHFLKAVPPTYNGSLEPKEAANWHMGIDQTLETIGYSPDRRVPLASYQLKGDAMLM